MQLSIKIEGDEPIIMHNGSAGIDPTHRANIEKKEVTGKRGGNRTSADDARLRMLEVETSLWLNGDGKPTIPGGALRACLETAARKSKRGAAVREGLQVIGDAVFEYDEEKYGKTLKELCKQTQYTVGVVVQRSRILRTRAKFDEWAATFQLDIDEELVDAERDLPHWLDIGGRRIGLGDWRPEKSGCFGKFHYVP